MYVYVDSELFKILPFEKTVLSWLYYTDLELNFQTPLTKEVCFVI